MSTETTYVERQQRIHNALKDNWIYAKSGYRKYFLAVLFIGSLLMLTALDVEMSMRFLYFNVILFLVAIVSLAVALSSAISKSVLARNIRYQFFGLALASVLSTIAGGITLKVQTNRSIQNGQSIVHALERYRLAMGSFPNSLQQLTPDFISQIPHSAMGLFSRPFYYATFSTQPHFELYFMIEGGQTEVRYKSKYGTWEVVDSDIAQKNAGY